MTPSGYQGAMELSLLLIIIGIVLAVLVHYALGIVVILIGLVLLLWPRLGAGRRTTVR
jgi:succinate dehydrogenase/fumarate reductase cytochrome b subunit